MLSYDRYKEAGGKVLHMIISFDCKSVLLGRSEYSALRCDWDENPLRAGNTELGHPLMTSAEFRDLRIYVEDLRSRGTSTANKAASEQY